LQGSKFSWRKKWQQAPHRRETERENVGHPAI
jgi:hypothetical protein